VVPGPPVTTFGFEGFPNLGDESIITEDFCNHAVCFRLTGGYQIVSKATLVGPDGPIYSVTSTQQILAPRQDAIGFVRFKRRLFVTNTTTISFQNGMIWQFKSSDPSEMVGFFALPGTLLQTSAIMK
jgi:hypothetical protein